MLNNDTDVDSDKLTAINATEPEHGQLTLESDGSFSYEPDNNFSGEDAFTYQASDGSATSAAAKVTITVEPVDDPPTATDQTVTTLEDDRREDYAFGLGHRQQFAELRHRHANLKKAA